MAGTTTNTKITTTDKQLKDKAVDIKGKKYVLVSDRVLYFNEQYSEGSITTELLSPYDSETVVVKATVSPDGKRLFTGYSQEKVGDGMINKTSALENAETSAVGRALAMMGIGVIESIASVDEINKANNRSSAPQYATAKQIKWLRDEAMRITGLEPGPAVDEWIEETIGQKPNTVLLKGVKGAVDKIRATIPKDEIPAGEIVHEVDLDNYDVTDEDLENLKRGSLPY